MSTGMPTLSGQQPTMPLPGSQGPQQGLQQQANPILMRLSQWPRVALEIGQFHPQIMDKMQKVAEASREALLLIAREQMQGQHPEQASPSFDSQASQASQYPPSGY